MDDMEKFKILATSKLPDQAMAILLPYCSIKIYDSEAPISEKDLSTMIKGKRALLCLLTDPITANFIMNTDELKVISTIAAGHDNIDIKAATEKGIIVTNTPGALTETTADLAWALILGTARRIVEADKFTRAGKFKAWRLNLLTGTDIFNKTLGIIGFGRIGRAVARRALGFQMEILYNDMERAAPEVEQSLIAEWTSMENLIQKSDFISLHVPLTDKTYHLFDKKIFPDMKKTSFLINTSRGAVVNERDLINALRSGMIAGAGLDVYEFEPGISRELLEFENVILLPHIGSASMETRNIMAVTASKDLIAALLGKRPVNIVNPDILS
jgi:glyoxylate reductase